MRFRTLRDFVQNFCVQKVLGFNAIERNTVNKYVNYLIIYSHRNLFPECLAVEEKLMKKSYGGMIGNVSIIWKVNRNDEKMIIQKCQKTILAVSNQLTKHHTNKEVPKSISNFLNCIEQYVSRAYR